MWSLSGRAGALWLIRSVAVDRVRLTASANTIHVGRRIATAEGRVHDPNGR
jgi:acyl-CoA thioesterase